MFCFQGEGVAYRGRALVELATTLGQMPDQNVTEIESDNVLRVQKFMRRRKFKLHAAFLNATMVSAIDAPVEFELSIGKTEQIYQIKKQKLTLLWHQLLMLLLSLNLV